MPLVSDTRALPLAWSTGAFRDNLASSGVAEGGRLPGDSDPSDHPRRVVSTHGLTPRPRSRHTSSSVPSRCPRSGPSNACRGCPSASRRARRIGSSGGALPISVRPFAVGNACGASAASRPSFSHYTTRTRWSNTARGGGTPCWSVRAVPPHSSANTPLECRPVRHTSLVPRKRASGTWRRMGRGGPDCRGRRH